MRTETVFTDERCDGMQIRWSGGATFNIWCRGGAEAGYYEEDGWTNTDCFTHYGDREGNSPTPEQAKSFAEYHFEEMAAEEAHHALTGE